MSVEIPQASARGLRNWSGKPGFRRLRRKCAQILKKTLYFEAGGWQSKHRLQPRQQFRFQNENQLKFLPQKTILDGTSGARLCFRIPRKGL
jgi:hypothetical protein